MNYERPKQTELTVVRTVAAKAAEIYDVWLDPSSPGSPWFGSERVILDARPDGLFYHCITHEGSTWAHYGRFVELERGRRIEHTWVSEATRGLETVVTVSFEPDGTGTRVTLHHAGVPDDAFGRQHGDGWGFVLGAIERRFS